MFKQIFLFSTLISMSFIVTFFYRIIKAVLCSKKKKDDKQFIGWKANNINIKCRNNDLFILPLYQCEQILPFGSHTLIFTVCADIGKYLITVESFGNIEFKSIHIADKQMKLYDASKICIEIQPALFTNQSVMKVTIMANCLEKCLIRLKMTNY